MNKLRNIILPILLLSGLMACEPNADLYEKLDNDKQPFNNQEKPVEYTLVDADYTRFGGFISNNKAFSDEYPAMEYVPDVLKVRYVTHREKSRALVTFNHFLTEPDWWNAGFGYQLTNEDYASINVGNSFSETAPANQFLPFFLAKKFPLSEEGDQMNIIYLFNENGELRLDLDTCDYNGSEWTLRETVTDIPYVGYELQETDYEYWDGELALQKRFSETYLPEDHIPAILKIVFPAAKANDEQVVKYRYNNGSSTSDVIDKYQYDGAIWHKVSYYVESTEQYIYGELGWAFDPTVMFDMGRDDYMYLAVSDPIPHETYNDFGYYYGASAFYSNFDVRLIGRRLNTEDDGSYTDTELGAIYDNEGAEAAMEEMLRRIAEEGIIELLQYKFPDATPQVGGIDVHYFVNFQTFADNWVREFPACEYRCTAAGSPPQFELVRGPYIPGEEE